MVMIYKVDLLADLIGFDLIKSDLLNLSLVTRWGYVWWVCCLCACVVCFCPLLLGVKMVLWSFILLFCNEKVSKCVCRCVVADYSSHYMYNSDIYSCSCRPACVYSCFIVVFTVFAIYCTTIRIVNYK
jgi:hypothetical protein